MDDGEEGNGCQNSRRIQFYCVSSYLSDASLPFLWLVVLS